MLVNYAGDGVHGQTCVIENNSDTRNVLLRTMQQRCHELAHEESTHHRVHSRWRTCIYEYMSTHPSTYAMGHGGGLIEDVANSV